MNAFIEHIQIIYHKNNQNHVSNGVFENEKESEKKIFLLLGQRKSKVKSNAENNLPKTGIIFVIEMVMCPSSKHLIFNL